jgi:hypothetical protein
MRGCALRACRCCYNSWDSYNSCDLPEEEQEDEIANPEPAGVQPAAPSTNNAAIPTLHPTDQKDVVYVEFETADR